VKHLLKLMDLAPKEIAEILNLADQLKMSARTASATTTWRARPGQ
jgi:ornithine carbamoyltransferase